MSRREESVQEVLAVLIAGRTCGWFVSYSPGPAGADFLRELWSAGFHDEAPGPTWFVSEFELPVPPDWRREIPYTYRCPDFACGAADRALIVELKTERGSYQPRQAGDYLRLARHKLPDSVIDVILLGPHLP